jgi:hypothetical protein
MFRFSLIFAAILVAAVLCNAITGLVVTPHSAHVPIPVTVTWNSNQDTVWLGIAGDDGDGVLDTLNDPIPCGPLLSIMLRMIVMPCRTQTRRPMPLDFPRTWIKWPPDSYGLC